MEKTTIIISILAIGLIVLGSYLGYTDFIAPRIEQSNYDYYVQGSIYGSEQVILKINQESSIPVIIQNGNSSSVQWTPIAQICNG